MIWSINWERNSNILNDYLECLRWHIMIWRKSCLKINVKQTSCWIFNVHEKKSNLLKMLKDKLFLAKIKCLTKVVFFWIRDRLRSWSMLESCLVLVPNIKSNQTGNLITLSKWNALIVICHLNISIPQGYHPTTSAVQPKQHHVTPWTHLSTDWVPILQLELLSHQGCMKHWLTQTRKNTKNDNFQIRNRKRRKTS